MKRHHQSEKANTGNDSNKYFPISLTKQPKPDHFPVYTHEQRLKTALRKQQPLVPLLSLVAERRLQVQPCQCMLFRAMHNAGSAYSSRYVQSASSFDRSGTRLNLYCRPGGRVSRPRFVSVPNPTYPIAQQMCWVLLRGLDHDGGEKKGPGQTLYTRQALKMPAASRKSSQARINQARPCNLPAAAMKTGRKGCTSPPIRRVA